MIDFLQYLLIAIAVVGLVVLILVWPGFSFSHIMKFDTKNIGCDPCEKSSSYTISVIVDSIGAGLFVVLFVFLFGVLVIHRKAN
jgi:hypothetical protein